MTIINLKESDCKHCGSGKRSINIRSFRKEFTTIGEGTLHIWNGRQKCWRCKSLPQIGEIWGISLNHTEKNRLFCPDCAEFIEEKLNKMNLVPNISEQKNQTEQLNQKIRSKKP